MENTIVASLRAVIGLLVLLAVFSGLRYRVPRSVELIHLQGEVIFRVVDIAWSYRQFFEACLGNKAIDLADGLKVYVSNTAYARIFPDGFDNHRKRAQTIQISFSVRKLHGRGLSLATIEAMTLINKAPTNIK